MQVPWSGLQSHVNGAEKEQTSSSDYTHGLEHSVMN